MNSRSKNQGTSRYQGMNWIRKDLRLAIYLRDGMACMWCGRSIEDGERLELDHVVPHSHGGSDSADNLICSCGKCNASRGNRSIAVFARHVAQYVNHGVTARQITTAIKQHVAMPVKPYRDEAKQIISRRPRWQAALESATTSRS